MKISELQERIFQETGLKTTVKKNTGSMKHHYTIRPLFQNGIYPDFPHEWIKEYRSNNGFKGFGHGVFCTIQSLDIPVLNFSEYDPIKYKKERKPKPVNDDKTMKGWGSKNSQMRLDKAAARYGKALRRGDDMARYC